MNIRLQEIIQYKTGGNRKAFAELFGWSPSYLFKLLNGDNFGITPIKAILTMIPEIDARWFLFGTGTMLLEKDKLCTDIHNRMQNVLEVEKYMSVMTEDELHHFEEVVKGLTQPNFTLQQINEWQMRAAERVMRINQKFASANAKSDELCKRPTVKK